MSLHLGDCYPQLDQGTEKWNESDSFSVSCRFAIWSMLYQIPSFFTLSTALSDLNNRPMGWPTTEDHFKMCQHQIQSHAATTTTHQTDWPDWHNLTTAVTPVQRSRMLALLQDILLSREELATVCNPPNTHKTKAADFSVPPYTDCILKMH